MKILVKLKNKNMKSFYRAGIKFTRVPLILAVMDKPEEADEISKSQLAMLKGEPMLNVSMAKETKKA